MIYEVMMGSSSNTFTAVDAVSGVLTQKNYAVLSPSGVGITNVVTKTADYAVTGTDDVIIANAATNTINITLPSAAAAPGQKIAVKRVDTSPTNSVYIQPVVGEKIEYSELLSLPSFLDTAVIVSDGTSNWLELSATSSVIRAGSMALLHMDGTDLSTTFVDSSASARAITSMNGAKISTAQSKFGGASARFSAAGDYIKFPVHNDFNLGTYDFTIEMWYRSAGTNQQFARIFTTRGDDTYAGIYFAGDAASGNVTLSMSSTGTSFDIYNSTVHTATINTWYHYALTRQGSTFRFFVDGVQVATFSSTAAIYYNSMPWTIGGQTGTPRSINGYVDEFRFSKGVARYMSNFTPATAAFAY